MEASLLISTKADAQLIGLSKNGGTSGVRSKRSSSTNIRNRQFTALSEEEFGQ